MLAIHIGTRRDSIAACGYGRGSPGSIACITQVMPFDQAFRASSCLCASVSMPICSHIWSRNSHVPIVTEPGVYTSGLCVRGSRSAHEICRHGADEPVLHRSIPLTSGFASATPTASFDREVSVRLLKRLVPNLYNAGLALRPAVSPACVNNARPPGGWSRGSQDRV